MSSAQEGRGLSDPGPIMITIPLAPRKRRVSLSKRVRQWFRKLGQTDFTGPQIDFTGPVWERRREFLQSLAIGLALNAALVWLLMLVLIADRRGDPDHAVRVVSLANDPTVDERSPSSDASSSTRPRREAKAPPPVDLATTTVATDIFFEPVVGATPAPSLGYDPAAMTLDFGASLTADDFRAARNGFGMGKNGRGDRGDGSSGVGLAEMGGFFSDPGLGDGSRMVLFLDVSGSMQVVSKEVDDYVSRRFKHSVTSEIIGCAINSRGCPVLTAFRNQRFRKERDQYFFICDLHDRVTDRGIGELRKLLQDPQYPKTLHVISFGYSPSLSLLNLVQDTGGTITLASKG